jgi:hypothetical protein
MGREGVSSSRAATPTNVDLIWIDSFKGIRRTCHLDPRAAVPASAMDWSGGGGGMVSRSAAHPEEADESRHEPADSRQEGKGHIGLPLAARVTSRRDIAPVEDVAAAAAEQLVLQG